MKKVLVSALVLALATVSVFASIKFSGEIVAGYSFGIDEDGDYVGELYGQDGVGSNWVKMNVTVVDSTGLFTGTLDGDVVADGRLGADLNVDLLKLFGLDVDFALKLGTVWNDRIKGLTAYDNTYSNGHPERLRTDEAVGFYVDFSYSDLVDARVGVIPKYNKTSDSKSDSA